MMALLQIRAQLEFKLHLVITVVTNLLVMRYEIFQYIWQEQCEVKDDLLN